MTRSMTRRLSIQQPHLPPNRATRRLDLELVLSVQHERQVGKDNTVQFEGLALQLSPTSARAHFVRCPVLVHELLDDTLGVSYQGRLVGRFDRTGLPLGNTRKKAA